MANSFIKSKVITNQELNYKFRLLKFETQDPAFIFKTGQFTNVRVAENTFRSYSIATHPGTLPSWEIFIDTTPRGPGSQLMTCLKPGDEIETTKPAGHFYLEEANSPYIMVATGCGMASVRPMIEELLPQQKQVYLLWGLRFIKDIVFEKELENWHKNYDNFDFEIVLSKPEEKWPGKTGHVTEYVVDLVKKLAPQKPNLYLCGNSSMIEEVNSSLSQLSDSFGKIHFERYLNDGKK